MCYQIHNNNNKLYSPYVELKEAIDNESFNRTLIKSTDLTIGELYSFLVNKECKDELNYSQDNSILSTEIDFSVNNIPFYEIIKILAAFADEKGLKNYVVSDYRKQNRYVVLFERFDKLIEVASFPYNKKYKGTLTKKEAKAKANQLVKDLKTKNEKMGLQYK